MVANIRSRPAGPPKLGGAIPSKPCEYSHQQPEPSQMTPAEFIAKWQDNKLAERTGAGRGWADVWKRKELQWKL